MKPPGDELSSPVRVLMTGVPMVQGTERVLEIVETSPVRGEVKPRIAVLGLFGMMNWLYTWYRPDVDGGPDGVAEQMTTIFLRGLLAG